MNAIKTKEPTHIVTYKGQTRLCTIETFTDVTSALVKELGADGSVPVVRLIAEQVAAMGMQNGTAVVDLPAVKPPANVDDLGNEVSLIGKLRATSDEHEAIEAGFAPKPPIYAIGTRVNSIGVDNAREMQLEHDAKPTARELATNLIKLVKAEDRVDLDPKLLSDTRMLENGQLVLTVADKRRDVYVNDQAFSSIMQRFPCASGVAYLRSCPSNLRAHNYNHWASTTPDDATKVVFRTRKVENRAREIYAAVSPAYTPFDADKIGEALRFAFPEDARGVLHYDGQRLRIEGLWRTDVLPEAFVAGEIFKAGVIVRSDDAGSGSIRVQSVIWRNLCRNLIILDQAIGVDIRLRHMGGVTKLAHEFQKAFHKALGSVEGFRKAWGYAAQERDQELVRRVQGTTSEDLTGLPASAVLPGIFQGILERELVPVGGRKKDIVPQLMELHAQDEAAKDYGVSRASIVNAFTRYAHQVETDPFAADEIRAGAGSLLSAKAGREPAPLPFVPFMAKG